jgi:transposase
VLAIAPTPATAARLTKPQIVAALRRAGRHRGLTSLADTIQQHLRTRQLRHPTLVEDVFGVQALAVLATLDAEYDSVDRLGEATAAAFNEHLDHQIITSFVGLADLNARLLAEIGDDRTRFADARALKAFAGSAPVTKASGHSIRIAYRHVKSNRLAAVGFVWAFVASGCQGPTRAHYLARRDHGDRDAAALRHLYNRMLGQLYHCLQTSPAYDPIRAYGPPPTPPEQAGA